MRLQGKCAIVTGAGSGFGEGIALRFAAEGARVMVADINMDGAGRVASACGGIACRVDVADGASVEAMVSAAMAEMGQVDILVNNAGITKDNLFMRMKDEEWQSVLEVNLTSTMRLCRGVMRGMMKARWGRIINISSIVGATGNPGQGNYAASKAGMIGMSKSIAYEVANRGITVNAVAPGFIATAMTDKLNDGQKDAILTQIPAGRMGDSKEIAAAVLYLASPEASYVTGTTLHVNGGMAML